MIAIILALLSATIPVRGTVRDSQRQPVADVVIVLRCEGTIRETRSDARGAFAFDATTSTPCEVTVTAPGFMTVTRVIDESEHDLVVELSPDGWEERIEVRASALSPSSVATSAAAATPFVKTLTTAGPDPARWLTLASLDAGSPFGTPTLFVNGLPASGLPETNTIASIRVAADPFSVETWGADRARFDITQEPPQRWQVSASPGLLSDREPDVLLDDASRWSRHRSATAAGSLTPSGRWRMFAAAARHTSGGSSPYVERHDGLDRLVADVNAHTAMTNWSAGISGRPGAWTVSALASRHRARATNTGVGGRQGVSASGVFENRVDTGQATWRRAGRGLIAQGGVSVERQVRGWSSGAAGAAMVFADRLIDGAPDFTKTSDMATRSMVRIVIQSASPHRGWLAGVESRREHRSDERQSNAGGQLLFERLDSPYAAATLVRQPGFHHQARQDTLAAFAQRVIADTNQLWIRAGVRAERQRGTGSSVLPRLSAGWRMGRFLGAANIGRFAEDWSAAEEIERLVRLVPAQVATPDGRSLTLHLHGNGARRTDTVMRASVVRPFSRLSFAVEETLTIGGHLRGLRRRRDADALVDVLDSDRSLRRLQTHGRIDVQLNGWATTVHYQHTRSIDDTAGTFSLPAVQRDMAAERGPSSGVPEHALTLLASRRLLFNTTALITGRLQSGTPYALLTGEDPDRLYTFTGRTSRERNAQRLPSSSDVSIYLAHQFQLSFWRLNLDTGARFENLLSALTPLEVERAAASSLAGQAVSAARGRAVSFWTTIGRR